MESKDYCTLTDAELYSKAETIIDELIKTGGKSFIMMVPARPNEDTDLILAELHQRFLKYWHEHATLQARCDRYEKALKLAGLDSLIEALSGEGEKEDLKPINWNEYFENQKEDKQ